MSAFSAQQKATATLNALGLRAGNVAFSRVDDARADFATLGCSSRPVPEKAHGVIDAGTHIQARLA